MMVRPTSQDPAGRGETPYTLITGLAATASTRSLAWLLGSALSVGAALLLTNTRFWPLSALSGTLSTVALWGFLAHRADHNPSTLLLVLQRLLVVVGALLALVAGLALFFEMLGPRWML